MALCREASVRLVCDRITGPTKRLRSGSAGSGPIGVRFGRLQRDSADELGRSRIVKRIKTMLDKWHDSTAVAAGGGLSVGLGWLLTLTFGGCSPPPVETTSAEYAVGMPTGTSSDPGSLSGRSIEPPSLDELNRRPTDSRGAGHLLVQTGTGGTPELVPTPRPDAAKAELVPTPEGERAEGDEPAQAVSTDIGEPPDYRTWPEPAATLVVTGQQHGYLEPCGCTGLDRQKGGVARRFTFIEQLRDRGWPVLPIDAGNQVRRFGRQAEIKLQQTARALDQMEYEAVGFGPDDLRLGVGELLAVAAAEDPENSMYVSANVVLIDPSLMPRARVIERGGMKIGVTTVLDPNAMKAQLSEEILINPPADALRAALAEMNQDNPDFRVVTFFGDEETARQLMRDVPGFDLLVVAGGYGEPMYQAVDIEDSKTQMIVTGAKGMHAGLVALYRDQPFKYARVALTHEFEDAPEMRQLMAEYQEQLKALGLEGLGLKPIPHPSGHEFVGTAKCGECHTTAYDIWQGTPHVDATADIVKPPKERGDVARHFDPECLSCHVTGWNPQNYYPYVSGYLSLEQSDHLTGNGCENCHGPGLAHATAEAPDSGVSQERLEELREQMKLSYEDAREKCLECHDLDNSPDFHEEDAFEDIYWPEVEHYGVD